MPPARLEVLPLPELLEAQDRHWFKLELDDDMDWQPDAWRFPVKDDQLAAILHDPELVSFDDKLRRLCKIADRKEKQCRRALKDGKWGPYVNEYVSITSDDFKRQLIEPVQCSWNLFWFYRNRLVRVTGSGPVDELALRIKHKVLSHEKALDKLRREVEAFQNISTLQGASREPISQKVQLFVWQRDGGRCVKCGCRERLEYDHIIPIAKGGSNSERNIQLLCESCNRSKGSTIS